jgi:hypothetical protein
MQGAEEESGIPDKKREASLNAGPETTFRVPHSNADLATYPRIRIPLLHPASGS